MRNEDGKRLDGSLDYGGQDLDAAILPPLAQGKDMEVLYADWCRHLPASAWQSLENAQWPELKVAVFDDSFHMDSQGLEGAPALLQLLARCPRLKSIKLSFCGGIAAEAWEALRAAEWPQLKEARWEMCFESGKPASGGAGIVMELLGAVPALGEDRFESVQRHCGRGVPAAGRRRLAGAEICRFQRQFRRIESLGPAGGAADVVSMPEGGTLELLRLWCHGEGAAKAARRLLASLGDPKVQRL